MTTLFAEANVNSEITEIQRERESASGQKREREREGGRERERERDFPPSQRVPAQMNS